MRGAVLAARTYGCTVILAGPEQRLRAELVRYHTVGLDLPVVDAPELIEMTESPAQAVRRKPGSPHAVGLRLVRDGEADAFVSAGHSGATMAGATLILGRASGVERPALAGMFPALEQPVLILDIGATTDCKPEYLFQFAHMGALYAERALKIPNPRVALLANGEEETKGDRLVQDAHMLLRDSRLNFVGNAEPKDALVKHLCEVLVCDGFVGNLFLKTAESVVKLVLERAKAEVLRGLAGRLAVGLAPALLLTLLERRRGQRGLLLSSLVAGPALLGSALAMPLWRVRQRSDYRSHGGAPLLGLNGIAIVAHGRSDARAVMNAIRQAKEAVERGAVAGVFDALERR